MFFQYLQTNLITMPKPKLPDELRKDVKITVRFLESDLKAIVITAKHRNCKTIGQYIRQLVKEDISGAWGAFGSPELPKVKRGK
jgi:predicted DNA binding CopG/RHH family protein